MKTGLFTATAVLLVQLVAAQRHSRGRHYHSKREPGKVKVITNIEYTTVYAEDVIVYVDQQGKPVTTKTVYHSQAGPTVALTPPSSSSSAITQPTQDPHPEPYVPPALAPSSSSVPVQDPAPANTSPPPVPTSSSKPEPAPVPTKQPDVVPNPEPSTSPPAAAPSPSSPKPASGGPGFGAAISYSPYNADNTCKSSSQVASDFEKITGYEVIRLYGTDCNQVANVLEVIKGKGVTLFVGIFDINKIQSEAQIIIDAVKGDWSHINTVSVGNELVNTGRASVGQVTGAVAQARSILKGAGYSGPVVIVDTMTAMKANPELCHASDYCAINCHAFFDGKVPAHEAGKFVLKWADEVSQAAGGKTTVITETGWPTQGQTNGMAVPSLENQQKAIESIKQTFSKNTIFYSSYNCLWKTNSPDTFGAEQYWGILGNAPTS